MRSECAVGRPWAADSPVVSVPNGSEPKHVTIVLPFYEAHEFLATHLQAWWMYSDTIKRHLSAVIVDDGSPEPLCPIRSRPFPIRVFRIGVDVPWNWLAARNIGAHHAPDGWLLMTDMDHVLPADTAHALIYGKHDPSIVYAFSRREHTGEPVNPHSASFFMTRQMFWRIGGYDERLSGVYGTDGAYRKRVMSQTWIRVLENELIRYEYVADSSVTRYERKTARMRELRRKRFASVPPGSAPKVLSFPYSEVAL